MPTIRLQLVLRMYVHKRVLYIVNVYGVLRTVSKSALIKFPTVLSCCQG